MRTFIASAKSLLSSTRLVFGSIIEKRSVYIRVQELEKHLRILPTQDRIQNCLRTHKMEHQTAIFHLLGSGGDTGE